MKLKPIAVIHTDFTEKFGIPRQSGLADSVGVIEFLPEYRRAEAIRGIEEYTYLWLLWEFTKAEREGWSPTVRPPRLGGNTRMGVFATRSPFRPNAVGLSSVRLLKAEPDAPGGPRLTVAGADLLDGTPVFDIKPYLAYTDSHPDAAGGFADRVKGYALPVEFPPEEEAKLPPSKRLALRQILAQDPRPSYQEDEERVYGFSFAGFEIRFFVRGGVLTVLDVHEA